MRSGTRLAPPAPALLFALAAALVLSAETWLVASPAFALRPVPLSWAVTADLCLVLPLLYWVLLVRPGHAAARTLLPVALGALTVATLLLPAEQRVAPRLLRALALPLELFLLWSIGRALWSSGDELPAAARAALGRRLPLRAAGLLAAELSTLRYALLGFRRAPPGLTFHRRAGWTAISGALLLVVCAEAVPLHVLSARLGPTAAWVSTALHAWSLLWLLGDLHALRLRRTTVAGGALRLRIGLRWEADVPLGLIESVTETTTAPPEALRLAVLGQPNLLLRLRAPVQLVGPLGRPRSASLLALQADQPPALVALLRSAAGPPETCTP